MVIFSPDSGILPFIAASHRRTSDGSPLNQLCVALQSLDDIFQANIAHKIS